MRTSRFGRALVALRDNEAAAASFGVDPLRLRLGAFALSGAIAALAGGLFVHHERAFDPSSYSPIENLVVLTMVVVGGMTSLAGAVLGALFLFGARWFLDPEWQFLASGIGVLPVLLLAPGGLAGLAYQARDRWLRAVAARSGMSVPGYGAAVEPDGRVVASAGGEVAGAESAAPGAGPPTGGTAPPGTALLDVVGIEVGYGGVPVLFGVDLAVREGEAVALLGTNGAGKSTLLRAISGLVPPRRGTITFDGEALAGLAPHQVAARRRRADARRRRRVPVADGGREPAGGRLAAPARCRRHGRRAGPGRELFPVLGDRGHDLARNLSGGQQQMLALAMAVVMRPRLLMIDELSLGLAPAVVAELLRFVDHLRDEGTTLVVVEQSVNVALEIAERGVFLERGQVRFVGAAADLLDRPDLLRSVFLGSATAAGAGDVGVAGEGTAHVTATAAAAESPPEPGAPVLRAVGLTVAFGGVRAVDGVSVDVGPGEIVGVIGPNGAGKSTLFDLLGGTVAPDAGRVVLAGADVTRLRASQRARRGLGRSFQDARLFPSLTVDETIAVALERWVEVGDPLSAAVRLPNALRQRAGDRPPGRPAGRAAETGRPPVAVRAGAVHGHPAGGRPGLPARPPATGRTARRAGGGHRPARGRAARPPGPPHP